MWSRIAGLCQQPCEFSIGSMLTLTPSIGRKCLHRFNHRQPNSQSEQSQQTRRSSTKPKFRSSAAQIDEAGNRDTQPATNVGGDLSQSEQRDDPRLPRSVQAVYLKPLKRRAQYGVPTCDLQLRSYNVRNVEFFADFALRAAYYLNLPAAGPIPLPRITERWTVPRSHFIFKKSQENFERITLRRLIQIQDGHPESVEIWLAFLRKHAYYGVGMKANVWRHEKLGWWFALFGVNSC